MIWIFEPMHLSTISATAKRTVTIYVHNYYHSQCQCALFHYSKLHLQWWWQYKIILMGQ